MSRNPVLAFNSWAMADSVRVLGHTSITVALGWLALRAVGSLTPQLVVLAYLAVVSAPLARIDFLEHRLPNRLVLPGYAFATVGIVWQWMVTGTFPGVCVMSGVCYGVFLLALNASGAMGMGDVKLGIVLGLAAGTLGPGAALTSPVLTFVSGGMAGIVAILSPNPTGPGRIPFGPFMLFGFWATVALGPLAA